MLAWILLGLQHSAIVSSGSYICAEFENISRHIAKGSPRSTIRTYGNWGGTQDLESMFLMIDMPRPINSGNQSITSIGRMLKISDGC